MYRESTTDAYLHHVIITTLSCVNFELNKKARKNEISPRKVMNARVNDFPFLTESRFKLKLLTSLDKENSQHPIIVPLPKP